MCGRFTVLTAEELRAVVDAVEGSAPCRLADAGGFRAQAFPGSSVSVIRRGQHAVEVAQRSWGFPAEWNGKMVFNTRIESALGGSAMWRDAIRDGRCIIPAATFFEPHETERATSPRTGKLMKRSYEFADEDGFPLLMAGVADDRSCSVVTTEPNANVVPVHPRMPLLLRFEEVPLWLEGSASDIAPLADRSQYGLTARPEDDQLSLF